MLLLVVASCASSYSISGSSTISTLDGKKLYLKVLDGDNLRNVDSCDVVHGKFAFHGSYDSTYMANICLGETFIMPIVVESGDIVVKMDQAKMSVTGSELNERLTAFNNDYDDINIAQRDLVRRHDRAIMDGDDMDQVIAELAMEDYRLAVRKDSLLTNFVIDNFDNVLGPGVFFLTTITYDYPMLTPWVEEIMAKATPYFRNNHYVKEYYTKALENQAIMNGLLE